jgi:hypothetical protein
MDKKKKKKSRLDNPFEKKWRERGDMPPAASRWHEIGRDVDDYFNNLIWWTFYSVGIIHAYDRFCKFLEYCGMRWFNLREIECVPYFSWTSYLWFFYIIAFHPDSPFVEVHEHTWGLPVIFIIITYTMIIVPYFQMLLNFFFNDAYWKYDDKYAMRHWLKHKSRFKHILVWIRHYFLQFSIATITIVVLIHDNYPYIKHGIPYDALISFLKFFYIKKIFSLEVAIFFYIWLCFFLMERFFESDWVFPWEFRKTWKRSITDRWCLMSSEKPVHIFVRYFAGYLCAFLTIPGLVLGPLIFWNFFWRFPYPSFFFIIVWISFWVWIIIFWVLFLLEMYFIYFMWVRKSKIYPLFGKKAAPRRRRETTLEEDRKERRKQQAEYEKALARARKKNLDRNAGIKEHFYDKSDHTS